MNGRFSSALPSAVSRLRRLASWTAEPDQVALRLWAALALSCLLHAVVLFLPYLGEPARETRFALKGRQKLPPVINATLAMRGEHVFSAANVSPSLDSVADLSAPQRPAADGQPASHHSAEGVGLLPLPAPAYYPTDQLSKRPQPLVVADLDASEIRPIVASGKIVLKLWINEFGVVADVAVEKSDLPTIFARTAVKAFKAMRFTPGERNGQPVGTVMRVEVTYADGRQF